MRIARTVAVALGATALMVASGLPAQAEGAFSVTANGASSGTPITNLPQSSTVTLAVSNLPANVGLYAFHCLVPPPGGSPVPTRCDAADGTFAYMPAIPSVQNLSQPIVANAQFVGRNPNPMAGDTGSTNVDCRTQTCAIYTLGAGRESSNPAYITFFPTQFAAASPQVADTMTVKFKNRVLKNGADPVVHYTKADNLVVTLASGITPSLYSARCEIRNGKIRALAKSGTCKVEVTSPGNEKYLPFAGTITFRVKN